MEGSVGQLTDVEVWLKGVSIVGLPRNLVLVPDTGKPSSKTRSTPVSTSQSGDMHKVLETALFRSSKLVLCSVFFSLFSLFS